MTERERLRNSGALGFSEAELVASPSSIMSDTSSSTRLLEMASDNFPNLYIRVTEDPLTSRNLSTIISALTELHTKCWLIAKGRFADLIEYTQTHNVRFAEEANLVITRIKHNSPLDMSIGFTNLDP